tara:strand:- start:7075 stop:7791 length:717 start_codon:yes stop_codon:yes gene_type:complete
MSKYSDKFLTYLREQENGAFLNGTGEALHDSPEGGTQTVGFGHKLTKKEQKNRTVYGYDIDEMTVEQAEEVMLKDLEKHEASLANRIATKGVVDTKGNVLLSPSEAKALYNNLDRNSIEMLVDFEYNLGNATGKFPKFSTGVLTNNPDLMRKEYHRKYEVKKGSNDYRSMVRRNNAFAVNFLPEDTTQFSDLPEVPTEPGTLDYELPPVQTTPVEEEEVPPAELQATKKYISSFVDDL